MQNFQWKYLLFVNFFRSTCNQIVAWVAYSSNLLLIEFFLHLNVFGVVTVYILKLKFAPFLLSTGFDKRERYYDTCIWFSTKETCWFQSYKEWNIWCGKQVSNRIYFILWLLWTYSLIHFLGNSWWYLCSACKTPLSAWYPGCSGNIIFPKTWV